MRFIRTVSVKHHGSGDHFQLSIPAQVAQAICLEEGGLVSIEVKDQAVSLQAYRDSGIAWREQLRPGMESRAVAVPPRTLGPSKPWGSGEIMDFKQTIRELRAARLWIAAEFRKTFPRRRGRRRCR
jgi:antitoxin component of MazEF toxin-antitoxin module